MMSPFQQKAYQGDEVGEGVFRWKSTTQMADELPDLGGSHVQIELGRELMTDRAGATGSDPFQAASSLDLLELVPN